jgi:hypothetical protein
VKLCQQLAKFANETGALVMVIGQHQVQFGELALLIPDSSVELFEC